LAERKDLVLRAVVERYIATGEPVSSAWVSESADLGVCPATVRHEMSDLERAGCLDHPHTSAGRVPTDEGYRQYVAGLIAEAQAESESEPFEAPEQAREVEPALEATCRALARLTHYLSLAQPPDWGDEKLTHLELSRLDAHRVLAVLLTQSGRVHHALLEFSRLPRAGQLRALATMINDRFRGAALGAINPARLEQAVRELWPRPWFAEKALRVIAATLPAAVESMLIIEGGSHLLEAQEFRQSAVAQQVFGLIEDRSCLRGLLARRGPGLSVMIGEEAGHPAMQHCALMAATFEAGGGSGAIAILGPKRMRYRPVMSALLAAARRLGAALAQPRTR
jgi:heat-inducible transcriptional repressor